MWVNTGVPQHDAASAKKLFRFEVLLLSGPVTMSFVDKHPEPPSRVIDIRGFHTLEDLHQAIFTAFDREDAHMYEFQIGGKKPMDRKAVHYGIALDDDDFDENVKNAETTCIAALNLKTGRSFFYWFDFGDDWWHKVRLLAINPPAMGKGRYPRIVEKKGESPPQYADWDEDDACDSDTPDATAIETIQHIETAVAAMARQRRGEISALIEEFCTSLLTESYVEVCGKLLVAAYGARLPLARGKAQSWAAGIVHAAGMINYLHDPASDPQMKLRDIAQHFGVSPATMENKSREIRDAVNAFALDPRFCLPEHMVNNPLVWLKSMNGIIIDFRTQPREMQEAALKAGLIPFIPKSSSTPVPHKHTKIPKKDNQKSKKSKNDPALDQYDLFK